MSAHQDHPHLEKERSIGYLVHEVARLFRRRFEDEARIHGVTLPQWRALAEIHRSEGISQVSLAGCIDTDPMTLSGILDRLERRGLIERYPDPNDSRAKLARLTPEGTRLVSTARNVGRELYENALSGLSPAERDSVAAGLIRIRDNLNNMAAAEKAAEKEAV
ncbi:MAG TPA: MarR family transcriptional regulator [Hypericibacter adhaerens]|uniref:MarR family winged helix-turn-helix transcriptional regulator n=1 Tax=Hypericibacter adhaerens TaxID=2602016 RepID=UPI002C1D6493|nr:MarR family transcriptional regulator [Hypericibacter adhaerens]HWA43938.1 MarR family transcriptional regulator [Hypericibacter adhaerens]